MPQINRDFAAVTEVEIRPFVFSVYAHFLMPGDRLFYIGHGFGGRPFETLGRNVKWKEIARQGKTVKVRILRWCENKDEAAKLEDQLIKTYRPEANLTTIKRLVLPGRGAAGAQSRATGVWALFSEYRSRFDTDRQFSSWLGCDPSLVSLILKGRRRISRRMARVLLEADAMRVENKPNV